MVSVPPTGFTWALLSEQKPSLGGRVELAPGDGGVLQNFQPPSPRSCTAPKSSPRHRDPALLCHPFGGYSPSSANPNPWLGLTVGRVVWALVMVSQTKQKLSTNKNQPCM